MESLASMPVLGWVALAAFVGFVAWRVVATRDKGTTDGGGRPPNKGGNTKLK